MVLKVITRRLRAVGSFGAEWAARSHATDSSAATRSDSQVPTGKQSKGLLRSKRPTGAQVYVPFAGLV